VVAKKIKPYKYGEKQQNKTKYSEQVHATLLLNAVMQ